MYKSRLLKVFKSLKHKEEVKLKQYLLHHVRSDDGPIFKLFLVLAKFASSSAKNFKQLDKQRVFEKIYGGDVAYDSKRLRVVMSSLLKLIERFLVETHIENDPYLFNRVLAMTMEERGLKEDARKLFESLSNSLEEGDAKGAITLQRKFEISHIQTARLHREDSKENTSIHEALKNLELLYAAYKLRYTAGLYSDNYFLKRDDSAFKLDQLLDEKLNPLYDEVPYITIYQHLIQAYRNPNEDQIFDSINKLIMEHIGAFEKDEGRALLSSLINMKMKLYRTGKGDERMLALRAVYDLYKIGLTKKLWIQKNILDRAHFLNIVSMGCTFKDFEFLESFLTETAGKLDETDEKSLLNYAQGRILYTKGDFEKSLEYLRDVEFSDTYLALQGKSLQLQCFYEIPGYEMVLDNFIVAFSAYVRRNKEIYAVHRKSYLNMLSLAKKLSRMRSRREKPSDKFFAQLKEKEAAHKNWVIAKAEELTEKRARRS